MADIKFGTDGWRGIIAWDFTFNNVRRMAQALAGFINLNMPSNLERKTNVAVVGYDRRFMSDKFAADIASILKLNKIDVTLLKGPVSTPMISCLSYTKFWFAIMVTASHNGPEYNGIKIKMNGGSVPLRFTKEIEQFIDQKPVLYIPGHNVEGKSGLEKIYFKYISSKVNMKKALSVKGKIAVDYMHGSSAGYVENLIPSNRIIALNANEDPTFGGIKPEPKESSLGELKKTVLANKCILGVSFDGDGDRSAFLDEKGHYLTPMMISAIVLHHLVKYKKMKGKVLQCISMGYLTKRISKQYNLDFEEVSVGFKNVAERTYVEDILFGAEESGGYCWKGTMPERDGLLLMMFLLEVMSVRKMKMSDLVNEIEKTYGTSFYLREDIPLGKLLEHGSFVEKLKRKFAKKILGHNVKDLITIDGLKIVLDDDSWLLIRPSGTEPIIRIYTETPSKKQTEQFLEIAKKTLNTLK